MLDQIFDTTLSWNTAMANAVASVLHYTPGYLATVTTPMEHNFLYRNFGYFYAPLGGSDDGHEGNFPYFQQMR